MTRFLPALLLLLPLVACETPAMRAEPSLARRPAEAIDPRLPVDVAVDARPVDASLATRLEALMAQARASAAAFAAAEPDARGKAQAAGEPQSESWIGAQLALSQLERTRAPLTRALAELDELRAASARSPERASPAEIAALEAASAELRGFNDRQAETLESIRSLIVG